MLRPFYPIWCCDLGMLSDLLRAGFLDMGRPSQPDDVHRHAAGRHLLQVTGGGFSSSSSMDTSQSSAATAPSSGMPSVPWGFYTVGSLSLEHVGSVLVYGIDTCQECGA